MKYIAIVFIICSSLLIAGERTGTKYFLNAGLNYNMHTTDIKGFSGTENCCDGFTGGNFLDPTFGFGMELAMGNLIFDMPASYVLQLNYNGLSSEYTEERFRGYKINEFDKQPIMVEHSLNPTIKLLSIGNSIFSELFSGFSFGLGADIGFVMTSDYSQNELALSPNDFTFSNGSREINTGEGTIEEMNSLIVSLFAGIRYDLYDIDDWTIRPEVKYNYIPGSLLDGKDLFVSQLSGSISFVYNMTTPEPKAPAPPPQPEPKIIEEVVVAPAPPYINVSLTLKDENGNEIKDGQKLTIPITVYETKQEYALRPVVFFDSADYNYKKYNIESFTNSDFDVQTEMINSISRKMKADNSLKLTLTTYDLGDEPKNMSEERLNNIEQKLKDDGVDLSRINSKTLAVDKDFKYDELKEEYRKVEFALSDNSELIKSIYEIDSRIEFDKKSFTPKTTINSSKDEYYREANLYVNENPTKKENEDFTFTIDDSYTKEFEKNEPVKFNYISNAEVAGIYSAANVSFTVEPTVKNVNQTINTINDGTKTTEQHILAYTEFDKSSFKSIDQDVLKLVRKALEQNRKVTIYASTDNLGNEEYNKALAERRANAAKSIIGGNSNNLQVIYPEQYLFSNDHPYGRMLNRAIVVRIDK
ncbi:MAG: OmpA family protein [Candidatus Kapaibacterium sp.]